MRIKSKCALKFIDTGSSDGCPPAIRETDLVLVVTEVHYFRDVIGWDDVATMNADEFIPHQALLKLRQVL